MIVCVIVVVRDDGDQLLDNVVLVMSGGKRVFTSQGQTRNK